MNNERIRGFWESEPMVVPASFSKDPHEDGIALLAERSRNSHGVPSRDAALLIVDEQEQTGLLLERTLRAAGYTRIRCLHRIEYLDVVFRETRPDLFVLNALPSRMGFHAIARVKILNPLADIPILVLTAPEDRMTRRRAFELGAHDFLTVPFDTVEALARVHTLLQTRWLVEETRRVKRLMENSLDGHTHRWLASQREVAYRLALAAEYRDNETGAHIVRMSHYAAVLGRAAGLGRTDRTLLVHAMPMHDIGKIGIPDRILLKPGPLTEDEWTVMKRHTVIGGELLAESHSPLLQMAQTIALTHHERWDGTGYPNQLAGDEIPLIGRICAICDVFDALTSERPYKPAWTVDAALDEIRASAGHHFDPHLVELFHDELPAILDIKRTYADKDRPLSASLHALAD